MEKIIMTNKSITFKEYSYLCNRIAYWLVSNNKKFNTRSIYGYFDRAADYGTIIKVIKERGANYTSDALIAEFVECAIHDNTDLSFLPNHVTSPDGTKYYTNTFVDMANRVSAYEVLNGKSPNIVYIQGIKNNNTTSNTTDATLKAFTDAFGAVTDFDSALRKVQGRGYGYYYNSVYNTATTLKRMVNKQGVNCTDSSQYFYRIALALGYEAQFVHVKCSGGDGHVRLRLKHPINTGGQWIYRDPAAVLKGGSITSNWCNPPAYVIAYNPSWIFNDLYQ